MARGTYMKFITSIESGEIFLILYNLLIGENSANHAFSHFLVKIKKKKSSAILQTVEYYEEARFYRLIVMTILEKL